MREREREPSVQPQLGDWRCGEKVNQHDFNHLNGALFKRCLHPEFGDFGEWDEGVLCSGLSWQWESPKETEGKAGLISPFRSMAFSQEERQTTFWQLIGA